MAASYTDVIFSNLERGGITATKLNKLKDDLSTAISAGGGGGGGTGDMTKAVYDTNNNGVVDTADSIGWTSVTGKPATFPPGVHAPSHNLGGSDPIAPDWTQVQNKPTTFPPTPGPPQAHQSSHVTGTDQIPSASTSVRGLMPQANGNANAFYSSDGTQKQVAYAMLSGSQPGPVTHGASHAGGASDPVPIATTTVAGLAPAKPNAGVNATTAQVVMGDDTRLSDTRIPSSTLAHQTSHVTGTDQIPSASTAARGLMPAANNVANNFYASDATQKQVTYAMLGGTQPAPVAHAATHLDNGSDPIAVVTATRTGLAPKLSGSATTYFDGTGVFSTPPGGTGPVIGFVTKSAAYTLTSADSAKYVICSGGSWTLTLPAPAAGLYYQVRNDMGISGTIGTITLSPTGGTIDGLASKPLLPQQECTFITDGTNWRTFGLKREVILGTQDITSSTASGTVLLPVGYRYFELDWEAILPATANTFLAVQFSTDGGTTWQTNYVYNTIFNSAASTLGTTTPGAQTSLNLGSANGNAAGLGGTFKATVYPGSASWIPRIRGQCGGYNPSLEQQILSTGFLNAVITGPVNALKYFFNSGNIVNSFLTVKGVV